MPGNYPPGGGTYPGSPGSPGTGPGAHPGSGGGGQKLQTHRNLTQRFNAHPVNFLRNNPGRIAFGQQILRSHGYRISVDGMLGPQTMRAAMRYHQGLAPITRTNNAANTHRNNNSNNNSNNSQSPHNARHGFHTGPTRTPKLPKAALGGKFQLINPMRYAKQQTRLQYQPILNQLAAQLAQQQTQGVQNLADLSKWYGEAQHQAGAATAADAAQAAAGQHQADAFRMGILGAIGGGASPGAGAVGSYADIMSQGQQGMNQNQGSYDSARQALAVSQAASAQVQQQRMDAQKLAAIQAAQQQALGQRASQLVVNEQNARQLYDQELAAKQAMALSGYNAQTQRQVTSRQLTQMNLQNKGLAQQLKKNGVNTNRGVGILRDPAQSLALHNTIESQLFAPINSGKGKAFRPQEAWAQMTTVLRAATGKIPANNRAVYNWVKTQYRAYVGQYVSYYNKAHPDAPVTVDHFLSDSGTPWTRAEWHARGVTWA